MAREEKPITPHAGPTLDADGNLTYVGDDGRRYVVGLPPDIDEDNVEKVMTLLRGGTALFQQIEGLCHRWIDEVIGSELDERAALVHHRASMLRRERAVLLL